MRDKEIVMELLSMEKYLADSLNTAARDVVDDGLHDAFLAALVETHDVIRQYQAWMRETGLSKTSPATSNDVAEAERHLKRLMSQLPVQSNDPNHLH